VLRASKTAPWVNTAQSGHRAGLMLGLEAFVTQFGDVRHKGQ